MKSALSKGGNTLYRYSRLSPILAQNVLEGVCPCACASGDKYSANMRLVAAHTDAIILAVMKNLVTLTTSEESDGSLLSRAQRIV